MSSDIYRCRQSGQKAAACDAVESVDVLEDSETGDPHLEVVVWGNRLPPAVMSAFVDHDLAVDPGWTRMRGTPTTTVCVARP
jgi:hypothetical protein